MTTAPNPQDDKELLELAAKAAGIDATPRRAWLHKPPIGFSVAHPARIIHEGKEWNPLTDDGDALRLAVKLSLIVCSHRHGESWAQRLEINIKEPHGNDANAATRRAIVRAAAEIARQESSHDR